MANVRYRKNQVFLWFTINSQSKLKNSVHCSRLHGGFFELEILDIFAAAFLLKTII